MNVIKTISNIPQKLIIRILKSAGYSSYFAPIVLKKWFDDLFKHKLTTLAQKFWAHRHGFYSYDISFYGLNKQNFTNYLPDIDYYRMYPINGPYSKWIDDKLTMRYVLHPFSEYLPGYYFHFFKHEIIALMDCPNGYQQTVQDVINLLQTKGALAAKLVSGSSGKGFYKLAYDGLDYLINNKVSSDKEIRDLFEEWLNTKKQYLITSYIYAHHALDQIYSESPSTVRIMVTREKQQIPRIVASYIKFGTNQSGIINNQVSGAVSCYLDHKTGRFSGGWITRLENNYFSKQECKYHPDSLAVVEGELPYWDLIKEKIIEISSTIQQVCFMGYDLIVTEDGFKIIEINSHQGIEFIQYYQPLLVDESSKTFFGPLFEELRTR